MRPIKATKILSILWALILLFAHNGLAQTPSIEQAGEMDLDTDIITNTEVVSSYFGMYIAGTGSAMLQVTAGNVRAAKTIMLRESSTRYVSFLLYSLSEELGGTRPIFKRGLKGAVTVSLLDDNAALLDSVTVTLNVRGTKRFCGKNKRTGRKKRCTKPDVANLSRSQQTTFASEFVSSLRGPIYLEP